jgi:hypothetical protein
VRPAAVWGGLGFLAGAVFWHAVGFWTFVSDAVFNGSHDGGRGMSFLMGMAGGQSDITLPTIFLVDPASCTALALDRGSNSTSVRPCPKEGLALRLEPPGKREDLTIPTPHSFRAAGYSAD